MNRVSSRLNPRNRENLLDVGKGHNRDEDDDEEVYDFNQYMQHSSPHVAPSNPEKGCPLCYMVLLAENQPYFFWKVGHFDPTVQSSFLFYLCMLLLCAF
jgi:hypothetical protein